METRKQTLSFSSLRIAKTLRLTQQQKSLIHKTSQKSPVSPLNQPKTPSPKSDLSPIKSTNSPKFERKSVSFAQISGMRLSKRSDLTPVLESKEETEPVKYVPYTLKDYHMQPDTSRGTLGAWNIGSEDWLKRKGLENRRKTYGRIIFQRNSNEIAVALTHKSTPKVSSPVSTRLRALEYSKSLCFPQTNPSLQAAETHQLHLLAEELKARILDTHY